MAENNEEFGQQHMSSDHFHLMLWFHFAHFHARICVLCSAAASLNRSVSTVTYWFVSTWCWWRDRGPTSRNRLLGGLLPPPSSICVTLRPPHRTAAVSSEQRANLSLLSPIIKQEQVRFASLLHLFLQNFQWAPRTETSLLHLFNPQPWTVAHLVRCACCSLDIYASPCCASCN